MNTAADPFVPRIPAPAPTLVDTVRGLRRDIHAHPELAFAELRTADLVARELRRIGCEVVTGIGQTGVVGVLKNGEGPVIALRADMDALPVAEANTFAHRSVHEGQMHACGHDGHTAMLLGAAEQLAAHPQFRGTVCLIFQPAEEGRGGAAAMLADGLLDRWPIERFYGLHNWPGLDENHFAILSGPVMAAADEFEIVIEGRGAHGAMPHLGRDPLLAGAALVQAVQSIVSRRLDPLDHAVVSVTRFHSGFAHNVIPAEAELAGTARSFRAEVQEQIEQSLDDVAAGIAASHGVTARVDYRRGYPATHNDAGEAARCAAVAAAIVGEARVSTKLRPSMGAEDFSFFAAQRPACYAWLGAGPGAGGCTLHSPHFDFNDVLLPIGIRYWTALVEQVLAVADRTWALRASASQ
jgi:hippurate hydrolase